MMPGDPMGGLENEPIQPADQCVISLRSGAPHGQELEISLSSRTCQRSVGQGERSCTWEGCCHLVTSVVDFASCTAAHSARRCSDLG
jgi:hypothetical protein